MNLFEDNVFLTRDLANIPHNKFVLISSIDQSKNSPYGVSKKISEIVVKKICSNYLIIRPSALLGKEMRKNTFQKIIHNEDIVLTPESVMNYVLYQDNRLTFLFYRIYSVYCQQKSWPLNTAVVLDDLNS